MEGWQEDHVAALTSIRCEKLFFRKVEEIALELGFDRCGYGIRAPFPLSRPTVRLFSNYPREWLALYRERNYVSVDPIVLHCIRSFTPIVWSDERFAKVRELQEQARAIGLCVGWTQSTADASGFGGMLTLARAAGALEPGELRDKQLKMTWLTQVTHIGMSRCLRRKLLSQSDEVELTDRERAILRLTADGKTSAEIGDILAISERTVNYHVNNAIAKLGAANRVAAVVKAAVSGLLH